MTHQEIFNKVITHLRNQGVQSIGNYGRCKYRGKDGTSCALGCLIDDKYYNKSLEGLSIVHAYVRKAIRLSIGHVPADLLGDLQTIHDDSYTGDLDGFDERAILFVSKYHGLTVPPMESK